MDKQYILDAVIVLVFVWVVMSFFGSGIKEANNNCGNTYPIDYVLMNNLFCEIDKELEGEDD